MFLFLNIFKKKPKPITTTNEAKPIVKKEKSSIRKGELGEYKINIQLAQLPKMYKYLTDIMITNEKSRSGYSQIDHVVITPYGIFVIETKNVQGTIYGGKNRKQWLVNGKIRFMNPFIQNYGHIQALKRKLPMEVNDIFSIVSFTKRCTFRLDELDYRKIASDELVVYDVELSEFINRKISVQKLTNKKSILTERQINEIYESLLQANITDEELRKAHIRALQGNTNEKNQKTDNVCFICKKKVSDKVVKYCLSNNRFGGKIYCFEHQRHGEVSR